MPHRKTNKTRLALAKQAVTLLLQQKFLHGMKRDRIGLTLFGCAETENDLADPNDPSAGYCNIVTFDPTAADVELLRRVEEVQPSQGVQADVLDALVVGGGKR